MKCYYCGGQTKKVTDFIGHKNNDKIKQTIMRCKDCGKGKITSEEYEKTRKKVWEKQKWTQ